MPLRILRDPEVATGGMALMGLSLSRGHIVEAGGILAAVFFLYFIDEDAPARKRAFYALASGVLGYTFYPGVSDVMLVFWPAMPETVRPIIGIVAVISAIPFVKLIRAVWARLVGDPDALFDWIVERFPRNWRRTRRDDDAQD